MLPANTESNAASHEQPEGDLQVLTFSIAGEEYGTNILQVREIKSWVGATPLPGVPAWVRGVMNLRGTVIPIIDMREMFELAASDTPDEAVVIVVCVTHGSEVRTAGLLVDSVSEVYNLAAEQVQPPPQFRQSEQRSVIGLATVEEKMLILLDVPAVLGSALTGAAGDLAMLTAGESHDAA